MQTRDTPEKITPLPPPPAPPARDANPWQWPEEARSRARPDRLAAIRRPGRREGSSPTPSRGPRLSLAVGIAVLVMTMALRQGLGDAVPRDWAGVMFAVVLLLGVFVLARLRRARRRADHVPKVRPDGSG